MLPMMKCRLRFGMFCPYSWADSSLGRCVYEAGAPLTLQLQSRLRPVTGRYIESDPIGEGGS